MKYEEYIEKVGDMFYEAIKNGTAPWVKEWDANSFRVQSHNPVTKTIYSGINSLVLDATRDARGYKDGAWLTFKQIKDLGGTVEKGSKSSSVIFFDKRKRTDKEIDKREQEIKNDTSLSENEKAYLITENKKKEFSMIFKYFNIFNVAQTKNIDMDKFKELYKDDNFEKKDFISNEDCQKVLDNVDVEIVHRYQKSAYYSPAEDTIVLPEKEQFTSPEAYYSAAFHELGHSTGHESRLNRDLMNNFGTEAYAKEELRAEIYSYLQARELGMDYNLENHQSYIESWTRDLEDKKAEIYEAVKDSFKILDYVRENYIEKAINKEDVKNISIEVEEKKETSENKNIWENDSEASNLFKSLISDGFDGNDSSAMDSIKNEMLSSSSSESFEKFDNNIAKELESAKEEKIDKPNVRKNR